jgi:YVTN family beta-propeller protein
VLSANADVVSVWNTGGRWIRSIDTPAAPTGAALSPDGARLYVTCAGAEGVVCVIDTQADELAAKIPAGHTPTGPAISPDGKRLYVCNRFDNDISIIDTASGTTLVRVPATREPVAAAITPDGGLLLAANHLPADRADQCNVAAVAAVVTALDTKTNHTSAIRLTTGSSSLRDVCVSPDGAFAFVTHILSHYHLPTIQLERGWMNTNALSVIDTATRKLVNTVLLDEPLKGAANPWGAACSADGRLLAIAHAGTHELSVIDTEGLLNKLLSMRPTGYSNAFIFGEPHYHSYEYGGYPGASAADVANDLTFLKGLRRRIRLPGKGPRGLAVVGSKAYVAECFSDTLAVVALNAGGQQPPASMPLGPSPQLTAERMGELCFHDAALCFQQWQSCSSCHPDARADGLNWDLLNDGRGNPKNTKSMLLAHATPPAMATGVRANAESAVRSGIQHIQFSLPAGEEAEAIDAYLKSLKATPSPHLVHGKLSAAARRGKNLFFREDVGCARCHPPPLYTDQQAHDVGSQSHFDHRTQYDTPTLVEVWRTAPYMHDGCYTTIKEVIVTGRHGDSGRGELDKLGPGDIDDLVEFVLSL